MSASTPRGKKTETPLPFTPRLANDQSHRLNLNIHIPQGDDDNDDDFLKRTPSLGSITSLNSSIHGSNMLHQSIPSKFESVVHLPSPMVVNGLWDESKSPREKFLQKLRDGSGNGGSLQVGKIRNLNLKTSPNMGGPLRMTSEFRASDVKHNQLHSPLLPTSRNFSSPLTQHYDRELEESKMEHEEEVDSENITIKNSYTAHNNEGKLIKYKVLRKIGKGSFSIVVLGEDENSNKVAIKISTVPDTLNTRSRVENSMKRELELLKGIDHPNIIAILLSDIDNGEVTMVMPHCLGGDLFSFSSTYRSIIKPQLIRKIFANLVSAVRYLHHRDVVHRDLKLENVLLRYYQDELLDIEDIQSVPPLVVLTDFGLSKKLDSPTQLLTTRCGSEDYVSPELLMDIPYDGKKNDVWAMGVLLYSLMESRLPFDAPPLSANSHISTASQRMRQTTAHRIALIDWDWYTFKDPELISDYAEWDGAKEIVEKCLLRKDKRCSIDDIALMSWVKDYM